MAIWVMCTCGGSCFTEAQGWTPFSNEDLVRVIRESGCRRALAELDERVRPGRDRAMRRLAWRAGLRNQDLEDAVQTGGVAQMEAIAHYPLERAAGKKAYNFEAVLHRYLYTRFVDFVRNGGGKDWLLEACAAVFGTEVLPELAVADDADGPEGRCTRAEIAQLVREELARLTEPERRVCACWMEGAWLTDVATDLGVTYKKARRLLARVRAKLEAALRHLGEGDGR